MNDALKTDLDDIALILEEIKRSSVDYLNEINEIPTTRIDQQVEPATLHEAGLGTSKTLALFNDNRRKLMVSSAGPRYWGFVVGGVTPAALAGDWLTPVFDQNTQSTQGNGDISAIVELETIRLMAQLLGLPDTFHGGFVTGATMSNFSCLAVGRQWAGMQLGKDIARDGMDKEIVVLAATPHSSVIKSLSMLGFGSNNIVAVNNLSGREAIDLYDLEQKLIDLQGRSVILNCSAGTVNTVDFDDLAAISSLKKKYKFWMHVDAAFGGFAACSEHYKHLVSGWEFADSITIDCHKWMNLPYDSAVFLVQKAHQKLQVQTFQNSNAPYLGNPDENFSYLNFLPENSRRFRALPAWFSLMAYGKAGFRWIVENNIDCAQQFGRYLADSAEFELTAPVRLNVVCFRLNEKEKTARFLDVYNKRGKVFMTATVLNGEMCIRTAFVNYRTSDKDIAIRELEETLKLL
ncbi:pyridoxal-dependent decarboxylase [Dyadobacter sp. LHD-138]|uniref:pyridoxal phosphate-dependent decarboxylase family protein n=1 Tax=Dyadobacter sp. LHD-138 TaxID=3071413 RepID=UPI0027DFBDF5|nr:pyridoxal-dependent decarboxylase [Dyadobacter sp. LHD-138]MDQ6481424.1 pyridoxal-dependent decarboxylase [Dyadobacter sp. LHD-138]